MSRIAMTRFSRACLNHAPIGSFRTRFFPDEPTDCPWCGVLQTRWHILRYYEKYRRPQWWRHDAEHDFLIRKESFSDMVSFLDDNPSAFTFADAPPLLNQWDI